MTKKEDFERIKERILKLKQSSQKLSERMTQNIQKSSGGSVTVESKKVTPQKEDNEPVFSIEEEEHRHKITQQEQQLQYINTKLANVEHEKKELQVQLDDLIQNNNSLRSELNDLEKERNELRLGIESLEGRVEEADRKTSLKYVLDIVEEFITEFMRHSRDMLGLMSESIHLCVSAEGVDERIREKIKLVEGQVKRLTDILSESVKKYHFDKIKFKATDLSKFVTDAVNSIVEKHPMQGITITNKFPERPVIVSTDPDLLGEVLENIILNSVESMIKGGQLDITCEPVENGVVLQVADTGVGIPSYLIGKIYRPFVSSKKGHYGLGLTRAYWIIKLLKCEIKIESAVNKGTKVRIVFPKNPEGAEFPVLQ